MELDRQSIFKAVEIDNPVFDAAVAASLRAQPSAAQHIPCRFFSFGLVAPQFADALGWDAHEESITALRRLGRAQQLCLATEVTPHPARVPMKCIGNAVHPLPVGEGWVSTPAPCALPCVHYIFQGLRLCLRTGGSRVISRGSATALAPAVFRGGSSKAITVGAVREPPLPLHASRGSAVVRQLPGVRLRAGWALRGRISYDRS